MSWRRNPSSGHSTSNPQPPIGSPHAKLRKGTRLAREKRARSALFPSCRPRTSVRNRVADPSPKAVLNSCWLIQHLESGNHEPVMASRIVSTLLDRVSRRQAFDAPLLGRDVQVACHNEDLGVGFGRCIHAIMPLHGILW